MRSRICVTPLVNSMRRKVGIGTKRQFGQAWWCAILSHLTRVSPPLQQLLVFTLLALAVFTASRLLLLWQFADRLVASGTIGEVLGRGWHFDVVVICAVVMPVLLVQILAPSRALASRLWGRISALWLVLWTMIIVWNEAATADFMQEFGVRPNRLYIEYLDTPTEIFLTIWQAHRTALLVGTAVTLMTGRMAWSWLRPAALERLRSAAWLTRVLVLVPFLAVALIGLRGSLGHRPLSISYAAFSTDSAVNDLALNSTYSVVQALMQLQRERKVIEAYGDLPRDEVINRIRTGMQLPAAAFADPSRPTEHRLEPTAHPGSKPNLVILLQESMGAQYVKSLGGLPVAQKLESWRTRSLWFDQLYASGTRSARGLEAVVSGFLPTRAPSVLKLEGAQHEFFTLASALKAAGYHTEFIYGGDSSFDNMRRFFLDNGFERVLDWSDMADEAQFKTTWGVSDEDLYRRVDRELRSHASDGKPFFTLVFSTSNHPPYDFPDGRIALFEQPKMTQRNAARYADFAVGSYLEQAQRSAYWPNTLFMVVADHETRIEGGRGDLVPIEAFHIPGFIAGGPVRPAIVKRLASQTDLLPTVLSVMGVALDLPATGLDESRTDLSGLGQAIMQFHDTAAFRRGDDMIVLQPDQPPEQFRIHDMTLTRVSLDADLTRTAVAYALWPVLAYQQHWYR